MRTYIDIIPRPIFVADPAALPRMLLVCDTCGTWTRHDLTQSQGAYVCNCGTQIIYIINNAPHLWAV